LRGTVFATLFQATLDNAEKKAFYLKKINLI